MAEWEFNNTVMMELTPFEKSLGAATEEVSIAVILVRWAHSTVTYPLHPFSVSVLADFKPLKTKECNLIVY